MGGPRVGVVGVVRRRQGFGAYLARFLARSGATVPAFVASRPETIDEGREVLAGHGIDAAGFTSLDELLDTEPLDALVIASPAATHHRYLEQALDAGLHVLCEKPLVWDADDLAATAAAGTEIERRFREAGLVLFENCQWPYTLGAFAELHPAALERPLRHFEMTLSPASRGAAMLVDAISHPLSLLQALAPPSDGLLGGLCFSTRDSRADKLEVSFRYPSQESGVVVRVRLESHPAQPRPAGYAVNGLAVKRRVRMEDYTISFTSGDRQVPVPDPMGALVADFVAAVSGDAAGGGTRRSASQGRDRASAGLGRRLGMLAEIVSGFSAGASAEQV